MKEYATGPYVKTIQYKHDIICPTGFMFDIFLAKTDLILCDILYGLNFFKFHTVL